MSLGLLLAGVAGNLTDRIFRAPGVGRGHVIDFLMLPNWPVFNIADICINVAAGLILIQAFRGIRINGTRPTDDEHPRGRRMMTSSDHRVLSVPEGLAGERVDAAMARMFGLSRTRAAELIAEGHVLVDGFSVGKSDRVMPGAILDVTIPTRVDPLEIVPQIVEGIKIIHDDDSIVVIDKPVGVAVHPSPGWSGPTVVAHLVAAGFRIATSGASERQGIVQRLDVGTSGVMVICKSERAYSLLKNAFRQRTVDKTYHALVQGHPDPFEGTIDAPDRAPSEGRLQVRGDGRWPRQRDPLRNPRGPSLRQPARGPPRDRAHPPDPGAHGGAEAPVRRRRHLRCRSRR